jgi:Zn-dependent peptidase ImmA (M78 family)
MAKTLREAIHDRRRVLQNPYAYVDELDDMTSVRGDRQRLENPYAHIEAISRSEGPFGRFDGISDPASLGAFLGSIRKKNKYKDDEIEVVARGVLKVMWQRQRVPSGSARDPLDLLDPLLAFEQLDYEIDLPDSLGQFTYDGRVHEVAGSVDQQKRRVWLSTQFPLAVRNFTAAHELGHVVLHETVGLHRDRPLSGTSSLKDRPEYEADRFAINFLMPRKLVLAKFEGIYGRAPFAFNEETSFALLGSEAEDSRKWPRTLRELSRLLASATRFNGFEIMSLADQFRVSVEAMAIRLEELGLVALRR